MRDDHRHGGVGLLLEFPDLRLGLQYSLVHDPGEEGAVSVMFEDMSFEALFKPTPAPEPESTDDSESE